jgi:hypothetical protein
MARPSLFNGLLEEDRENIPLLLDRIYGRLGADVDRLEVQIKGRLSNQEGRLHNLAERLEQQENCPCQVLRDPAHRCPILEIKDQLSAISRRLAWYAGTFGTVWIMAHLAFWYFIQRR